MVVFMEIQVKDLMKVELVVEEVEQVLVDLMLLHQLLHQQHLLLEMVKLFLGYPQVMV